MQDENSWIGTHDVSDEWPNVIHGAGGGISPDWDIINNGFSGG